MGWYEDRFKYHPNRIECACQNCGAKFWLPKCEVKRRKTCGDECRSQINIKTKQARSKNCLCCNKTFIPRSNQWKHGGNFCSISCSTKHNGQLWTEQSRKVAAKSLKESIESGKYVPPKGEKHHQWTGGYEATRERARLSGKSAERLRNYRKNNPHFVKEVAIRRSGRKIGRLPKGTIERIGLAQKWRCVCCKTDIKYKYHVDHIFPLAKGGKHEPNNIQLLCPTCNVRKSAKHPIDFMQQNGYLL